MVSVILSTYNRAGLLKKTIESVLSQTYADFELIIVNDGSADNTLEVIKNYNDPRIRIINNEKNIGFVKSLNKGISRARGEYIARIDDDDFWVDKQKLEKQVNFLKNNSDYVLIGCGAIKINEKEREIKRFLFPQKDEEIRSIMLFTSPFIHSGAVFSKRAWQQVNGYDESLYLSQDFDLWAKLGRIGKMYNIKDYCVKLLDQKQSRTNKNIHRHILLKQKIRKKYKKEYPYFYKAYIIGWFIYLISFLPFQREIRDFLRGLFYER